MRTAGVTLIYAAVVLRGLVRLDHMQRPGLVVALLALYGLLLTVESVLVRRAPERLRLGGARGETALATEEPVPRRQGWVLLYLLAQTGLVVGLLLTPVVVDTYALLFLPLSLPAVLFLGRRLGFLCIAAFTLAMVGPLLGASEGRLFGLVMIVNYGGLCFLIGGYAHQVRKAEAASRRNDHLLDELRGTHRQLQDQAAQLEELAAEQERNRLARELHDSVTQTVFSMNLTVQSTRLLRERFPDRAAAQLQRLEALAAGALREIQALVSQLRPRSAVEEDLPNALHRLAAERLERDGLNVTVEVSRQSGGEYRISAAVAAGLVRIAQEALTNVAKHAGTQQATIRLELADGVSYLEISDAGQGFDPQPALSRSGHLGLATMAERARELGWQLTIESQPGGGTRIRVAEQAAGEAE